MKKEKSRSNTISWCVIFCVRVAMFPCLRVKMLVILLFSQITCQCPFGKGTLMEIVDLGMRNGLSTEIQGL